MSLLEKNANHTVDCLCQTPLLDCMGFLLAERRCNGASEDEDGLDVCDDWGSLGIHPSLTSLKAFARECLVLAAAPREQPPKRYLSLSRPRPSEFDPPPCFPIHWNLIVLIVYQVMSTGNEK
jgi:hypothetical protein